MPRFGFSHLGCLIPYVLRSSSVASELVFTLSHYILYIPLWHLGVNGDVSKKTGDLNDATPDPSIAFR